MRGWQLAYWDGRSSPSIRLDCLELNETQILFVSASLLFVRHAWLQSIVTRDSRHLNWDIFLLCIHLATLAGWQKVSALLTVRLNIAAVGTSFHVTDSTDIDCSKHPLSTIDITEQGPSFLFGQCTSKAFDHWHQWYGWYSNCCEVVVKSNTRREENVRKM